MTRAVEDHGTIRRADISVELPAVKVVTNAHRPARLVRGGDGSAWYSGCCQGVVGGPVLGVGCWVLEACGEWRV